MTTSSIVAITDKARAIMALDDQLADIQSKIDNEQYQHQLTIEYQTKTHHCRMTRLHAYQEALKNAIYKLGG